MKSVAPISQRKKLQPSGMGKSKPQTIHSCNFRYAGRLSNENARALTSLHQKFALSVSTSLELYLGISLKVEFISLEQMAIADHVGRMPANRYLLPCALNVMETNCLLEMDGTLVFPIIDLLLGGMGSAAKEARELTEIDEEIMQTVTALIVKQIEASWRTLNLSLTPGRCIKPNQVPQAFVANEKLVLLMFEMTIGETTGPLNLTLPTSFVGFLLRHLKAAQLKKISSLRATRNPSLRERILDCDFVVAADITEMRVLVKDLIALKVGMILKLKAPVKKPGCLTVEDVEVFEALPVRNGDWKAAQVSSRSQEPTAKRE